LLKPITSAGGKAGEGQMTRSIVLVLTVLAVINLTFSGVQLVKAIHGEHSAVIDFRPEPTRPKVGESVNIRFYVVDSATGERLLHVEATAIILKKGERIFASPEMHRHEGEFSFLYNFQEDGDYVISVEAKSTHELGAIDFSTVSKAYSIRVEEVANRVGVQQTAVNGNNTVATSDGAFMYYLGGLYAAGFFLWYYGPKRMFKSPMVLGVTAGVAAFISDLLLIYFGTGLYKYAEAWYTIKWIMGYYSLYLIGFSIGVGAMIALMLYAKRINGNVRRAGGLGILGTFASGLFSLFFVCCAPLMVSLITLFGGTILFFIIYSQELFTLGMAFQAVGIIYGVRAIKRMKEASCCYQPRT